MVAHKGLHRPQIPNYRSRRERLNAHTSDAFGCGSDRSPRRASGHERRVAGTFWKTNACTVLCCAGAGAANRRCQDVRILPIEDSLREKNPELWENYSRAIISGRLYPRALPNVFELPTIGV